MSSTEEVSLVATGLAVIALLNWLAGDRSFRGRELFIRRGAAWTALRWLGLGLWVSTIIATSRDDFWFECSRFVGAGLLLLGTARQSKKPESSATKENQNGEQAVAPQPAARSESDFSGSLPPST